MAIDYTGGVDKQGNAYSGYSYGYPITITGSGVVSTIGVNWYGVQAGYFRVALYSPGASKPANLLTESASVAMNTVAGWQDIAVSAYSVSPGSYWLGIQLSVLKGVYYTASTRRYYTKAYGAFDDPWQAADYGDTAAQWNMRITYAPAGWTGKISGVTNPAKIMGVDVANIASVKGVS